MNVNYQTVISQHSSLLIHWLEAGYIQNSKTILFLKQEELTTKTEQSIRDSEWKQSRYYWY